MNALGGEHVSADQLNDRVKHDDAGPNPTSTAGVSKPFLISVWPVCVIVRCRYALLRSVTTCFENLPGDLASAHAMILAQREMLIVATSEAKVRALEIERLKLMLAKARREMFGQSSERGKLLVEQLELAIKDLEATQAEEETKAEIAAPGAAKDRRARAPRRPRKLPDNLPGERVVEPAPCACGKCGGVRLRKLGEEVSKTLECDPRRWKIVEHVREKFTCRDCEAITEPPAPSRPIPRGLAGPSLLAMVLSAKFLLHQPLNRQSATYAREGVEIDVSTLAGYAAGKFDRDRRWRRRLRRMLRFVSGNRHRNE